MITFLRMEKKGWMDERRSDTKLKKERRGEKRVVQCVKLLIA